MIPDSLNEKTNLDPSIGRLPTTWCRPDQSGFRAPPTCISVRSRRHAARVSDENEGDCFQTLLFQKYLPSVGSL